MKTEVQMLNKNNELFSVYSEPCSQEVQLNKISISLLPWACKLLSLCYGCAACLTQQSSRGFHQASALPQHRSLFLSGLSPEAHMSGATAGPPQGPPCSMQEPPQKFLRCKAHPFVCRAPSCRIRCRAAMSHTLHAGTKAAINPH